MIDYIISFFMALFTYSEPVENGANVSTGGTFLAFCLIAFVALSIIAIVFKFISKIKAFALFGG